MMLNTNLNTIRLPKVQRKNWSVLPPGEYPFEIIEEHIDYGLEIVKNRNIKVIKHRVQKISSLEPNFLAVGAAGFTGYWVFGFSNKSIYILESVYPNNATYVLGENWENISRMSKSDILRNEFHIARLVHRIGWNEEINRLLK
ncbi:MAG: hypothetical protein K2P85_05805 [Flavobacteriaceae bacterium]|nr:hypothetical protein [Flavobacteriaceae bacterium]